jgi:hypothetical protein
MAIKLLKIIEQKELNLDHSGYCWSVKLTIDHLIQVEINLRTDIDFIQKCRIYQIFSLLSIFSLLIALS